MINAGLVLEIKDVADGRRSIVSLPERGISYTEKIQDQYTDLELAISPLAQGRSIGWLLGQAALDWAGNHGGKKIYLESNTLLKPAINLYHKLGFQKVAGHATPYKRCNIQMACDIGKRNNI